MKKILLSLVAIVAVAAVAGYGSYALWSDEEVSAGNSVTADQMDLILASIPMVIADAEPGETGTSSVMTLENDSNTVDGTLTLQLTGLVDNENGCPEAESVDGNDTTCGTPGAGEGDLSGYVSVGVEADLDGDTVYETTIPEAKLNTISGTITIGTILPGNTANLRLTYTVDSNTPSSFIDNIFMTDSSAFDAEFTLTQN